MKTLEIRNEKITAILSNTADDGRKGRAFEMSCCRPLSKKTAVSKQGEVDVYVCVLRNGKKVYDSAECKVNGGRVDSLMNGTNKSRFVIYKLDFVQKHKASKSAPAWDEIRSIPAVIVPADLFVEMLIDTNAYKEIRHNGEVDGIGIQPSSKRMFERLNAYIENYPDMVFSNETVYEDWMFEGLEL